MGPHNRAPRNTTRDQTSSRNIAQTWHYILKKLPTALNNINALQTQRRVYCSSRVRRCQAQTKNGRKPHPAAPRQRGAPERVLTGALRTEGGAKFADAAE